MALRSPNGTAPESGAPPRVRAALGWILVALAVAWAGLATWRLYEQVARHSSRIADVVPLYLGGRALLDGLDPTDPAVLEHLFQTERLRTRPPTFLTYYPQSADLLFAPISTLDYRSMARWVQLAFGSSLLVGTALGAGAGLRGRARLAAWAIGIGAAATLPVTWILVNIGQSNALLVLLMGVGLWALARDQRASDGIGGVAIGIGIALKLVPALLLVPALVGRRWRIVALATAVPLVVFLASLLLYAGPWHGSPIGLGAVGFADAAMHPAWQREPAWLRALWHGRVWGLGALVALLTAWPAPDARPHTDAARAALVVAWVGTVMSGSAMPHQGMLILPALGWVLAWPLAGRRPWLAAPCLAAVLLCGAWRAVFTEHQPETLQWLPVGYTVVFACAARLLDARTERAPAVS